MCSITEVHHQILELKKQIQIKFPVMTQKLWTTAIRNQILLLE